ncbi:phosphatidylserine decarboxylase family protein [soil metagenome]
MTAVRQPDASFILQAQPPAGVQPGGGTCLGIELAWGRLRRGYLRNLRQGYVRKMAALRQGECPGCTHDIIDPRDLKFCRNVCGYWFRPEDDCFAWRGRLGMDRAGLAELICFSLLFATLTALSLAGGYWLNDWLYLPLVVFLPLWLFVISFFRDPTRVIPTDPTALVSPADGKVTHIDAVDSPDFPGGRAFRISIFLSVFNVHVNRSPRRCRVKRVRYFPGEFLDARHGECAVRNEQLWVDVQDETTGMPLVVKQISGAIARRIVCWLKPGDVLQAGERFGMIKFGSRTEVLLPIDSNHEVMIKVGDMVSGGSTVLLRLRK